MFTRLANLVLQGNLVRVRSLLGIAHENIKSKIPLV
jgi:hypothetical protein